MIGRYAPAELVQIWSDQNRLQLWLRVELAVCEARAELGEITTHEMAALRSAAVPTPERVAELEAEQGHDLAAFVSAVQEGLGDEGRHLHLGLTSQDVVDTAGALQLREAGAVVLARNERLLSELRRLAVEHRATPMIGRTHGMHAEPLTFGFVLANHWDELRRCGDRLAQALRELAVGKISGTVGTHATASVEVEERALARLGLEPAAITTQVVARDRHAFFLCALALLGAAAERLATELRLLQRTEVGEVQEPFTRRQKGSSAMPHKRNPVRLEQVCGLARLLRGLAVAGMEDVALWHERDISHSSVERVALPDATMAAAHLLGVLTEVVSGLEVRSEAMLQNLQWRGQLSFSQQLLLALIRKGMAREEAYRMVQALAASANRPGGDFKALALASEEVGSRLGREELEECFALGRYLSQIDASFERLGLLGAEPPAPAGAWSTA